MKMGTHVTVNYESLVAAYQESLTTVLRGFRPAAGMDFLETWVHEEDAVNSILNIVEAAKDSGLTQVSIEIGPGTAKALDVQQLRKLIAHLGTAHLQANGEGMGLHVSLRAGTSTDGDLPGKLSQPDGSQRAHSERSRPAFSRSQDGRSNSASSPPSILPPVYLKRLKEVLRSVSHEGELHSEQGLEWVEASLRGVRLMALVDPTRHLLKEASYAGASSEIEQGLLELLCSLSEGKPIQECSDHAVIRLEYALRDRSQSPPVAGIIMPGNAGAVFDVPLQLIRRLLAEYQRKTEGVSVENFYDLKISEPWRVLSSDQRMARLKEVLANHPANAGVEVVRLEGAQRVVVKFTQAFDSAVKQSRLMQMETVLKEKLEPTLELYMEPKEDQNRPRQTKGIRP